MIIDLSPLFQKDAPSFLEFDFKIPLSEKILAKDDPEKLKSDVAVKARFEKTKEGVLGEFDVEGVIELVCDRCLQSFEKNYHTHFSQDFVFPYLNFSDNVYKELKEEGFIIDAKNQININEAIRQGILISLPMKKICKKDCQGLI